MEVGPPPQPSPPRFHEDFLRIFTKFEYFKRNSSQQADNNLNRMINSERTKEAASSLRKLGIVVPEAPVISPPRKKSKTDGSKPKSKKKLYAEIPAELSDEDSFDFRGYEATEKELASDGIRKRAAKEPWEDSDTSGVSMIEGFPTDKDLERLKFENLYDEFAEEELRRLRRKGKDTMRVSIDRKISNKAYRYKHDIKSLKVSIGHRRITFEIRKPEKLKLVYMSNQNGCIFMYGNEVSLIESSKYQSLAAKHFFLLVCCQKRIMTKLEFGIGDMKPPRTLPFSSFYGKINNYMYKYNYRIYVRRFISMPFRKGSQDYREFKLGWLQPKILKYIKIRVWDNKFNFNRRRKISPDPYPLDYLFETKQWKKAREVDVLDYNIYVEGYEFYSFIHFKTVHLVIPKVDNFDELVDEFSSLKVYTTTKYRQCTFHLQPNFPFWEAVEFVSDSDEYFEERAPVDLGEDVAIFSATIRENGIWMDLVSNESTEIKRNLINFTIFPGFKTKRCGKKKLRK